MFRTPPKQSIDTTARRPHTTGRINNDLYDQDSDYETHDRQQMMTVNSAPSTPTGASHNPNYVMTERPEITDPDSSGISGMPSRAVSMLAQGLRPFEDDSVITSVLLRRPAQPKQEQTDDPDATIGLSALRISPKGSARDRMLSQAMTTAPGGNGSSVVVLT